MTMLMNDQELNDRIVSRGKEFFHTLEGEEPSLFYKGRWVGKMMAWSMSHPEFRTAMLRFVDVFPCLSSSAQVEQHIREYFDQENHEMPGFVLRGVKLAGYGGALGSVLLRGFIGYAIKKLAGQFIVGETSREAVRSLTGLRREGLAFSIDVLGEATVTEEEAEQYANAYIELLDALNDAQEGWPPFNGCAERGNLDWNQAPRISVSLKPSSLYSQTRPEDFEGSVTGVLRRLRPVYEKVIGVAGSLCIDMEAHQHKGINLEVFRRLRLEYAAHPHLGIAMQSYLRDTDEDLPAILGWMRDHGLPSLIRLVKGAYWDYEVARARQNGWPIPVFTSKPQTDAAFERHVRLILEQNDVCHLACGSHNIRSIAAALELARDLGVPETRYEFQVLYGMAEPIRRALLKEAGRVRLYCPYGRMVPGMAYLVRRLLENTANQGFLRRLFDERMEIDELLRDPKETADSGTTEAPGEKEGPEGTVHFPPFRNQPASDFAGRDERDSFPQAIAMVRNNLGKTYPLYINAREITTTDILPSVNPARPDEVIGHVCQAGKEEADEAIRAAQSAFPAWRAAEPRERAAYLLKAAASLRSRRHELAAWQILEIGKQWDQASADVAEACDFLEYYAREMVRLGTLPRLGSVPGEVNQYLYEPRGVTLVIAPWNFPLAISAGMVSAAIVSGNCVVYKPSPLTPVIGHHLVEIFRDAGLPAGVFNYVPGRTEVIAEFLVDHAAVSTIAFTGSTQVGLSIIERAARVHPGQMNVKRVICEMGGKNAIIVDDDADLDEAIPAILVSAFGFQGQKCSSCSRVIVLESIYDQFIQRLVKAAKALAMGPAEDPAFALGPVADEPARTRILKYIEIGRQEGRILYMSPAPEDGGFYVPLTIISDIRPDHRIAQEEIFGPVLAVMKVTSFAQALEWANSTRFALTGGVFSRSPRHLEEARRQFRVGNLYLNRQITGALVERQPFGGFRMSGLGTKAGGPEYLLHFMDPRVVTENTMRRGFAPDAGSSSAI
jgi:RHH-type transcriptional regulator, proline utilization regulon repressor / proline dehydrogenase / delta 1-pyrroline-5-carboxylate dehydrogenase